MPRKSYVKKFIYKRLIKFPAAVSQTSIKLTEMNRIKHDFNQYY